jgi:anti-sigma regulatory factor (Ser/Thr protein kinase)
LRAARRFGCDPASVRGARRFTVDHLDGVDADVVDAITLLVSELATNAVTHAHTGFTIALQRTPQRFRVDVRDGGQTAPTLRSPTTVDLLGRGLRIVQQLAQQWGARSMTDHGNNVWFTMDLGGMKPT